MQTFLRLLSSIFQSLLLYGVFIGIDYFIYFIDKSKTIFVVLIIAYMQIENHICIDKSSLKRFQSFFISLTN